MSTISDEMLMAYADGELAHTDLAAVEAYLARDLDAQTRLAIFTQTGKTLGDMFGESMSQPVPQRLIDAIMAPAAASVFGQTSGLDVAVPASSRSAEILPFERDRRMGSKGNAAPMRASPWGIASSLAAACVALVVFEVGAPWGARFQPQNGEMIGVKVAADGVKVAGPALTVALDQTPSNVSTALTIDGGPASVRPVFTFASAKGFCRQYDIATGSTAGKGAANFSGVACRDVDKHWIIESQVASATIADHGDKIAPAGRESAPAIDALVERLISGDVLGPDEELGVMRNGWRNGIKP